MFTGIVEAMGRVARALDAEGARRVRIEAPAELLSSMEPGASVAVDGACLTAVSVDREGFEVDVVLSTLSRTIASAYEAGRHVNLERALILGERLDGHLVQGHVDGLGRLDAIEDAGDTRFLTFRVPTPVHALTLLHGSITLNGVSLTVNGLDDPDLVQVAIIPHTWSHTNLGGLQPDDAVNVEGDLLGKYVGRILATRSAGPGGSGS